MARPSRSGRSGKALPSVREANAAGYAKRQGRKTKNTAGISDVYEFQQQKVRRDKVALTLDREEAAEFGFGSDDDIDRDALRARLIGENVDNEQIDEDDDEELDSDAAFEESDEERFAGFSFASSKAKSHISRPVKWNGPVAKYAEVDLNESDDEVEEGGSDEDAEDEDEERDGNPEDFLDILDMLDGRTDGEMGDVSQQHRSDPDVRGIEGVRRYNEGNGGDGTEIGRVEGSEDAEEEGEENEDTNGEDDNDVQLSAEEDMDEDAVDGLGKFVSALDPSRKRKADDDHDAEASRRKRRVITERTQTGQENEFAAQVSGSSKIKLDDLLAPLTSQSSNVLALKKSAKALVSSRNGKTLSAPLPQRTQDRLDREAAYEQTKKEVDKWNETMRQLKEAEHLSFPLQAKPVGKTSNLELAAKFKPTTEMESSVDKLLKQALMREEDLSKTEELKMNHLSVEEVAARRAEVRKVRELMSRAEVKAKRMAKIKSKTYRRMKKKEREKLAVQLGEDDDVGEDAAIKREVERAKERATLRHKNAGKWAKAMKGRGELDEDQRQDIVEMLDRGEKLRRRIQGQKDSDASEDSDGGSDDDEDVEGLKVRAFEELQGLKEDGDFGANDKGKGVFHMKFMRDAATREQADVNRQVDDFMQAFDGLQRHSDDESGDAPVSDPNAMTIERTGGRVSFRPGNQSIPSRPAPVPPSETSSTTLKSTDFPPAPIPTNISASSPAVPAPGSLRDASNPWLTVDDDSRKPVLKKSQVAVGKQSKAAEKSKGKLDKRQRQLEAEKAKEDAVLEISPDAVTLGTEPPSASSTSRSKLKPKATDALSAADDSDVDSEVEEQEKMLDRKGKGKTQNGVKAFEQRDFVAMAFAGDNVVQDFEEAKRREIQADAPKEVDTTLPGWGSWGGQGARKQAPKPRFIKKISGVDPKSRADYGKKHVIISEKRDKKASKYMVKDLPYPYTSKAQFERSLDTPIGTEWNTRVAFQRATLPKVTKKMGVVINPLQKKAQ